MKRNKCKIPECESYAVAKGLCKAHYEKQRLARRSALKKITQGTAATAAIGAGLMPEEWVQPVIERVMVPAHAQTSPPPPGTTRPPGTTQPGTTRPPGTTSPPTTQPPTTLPPTTTLPEAMIGEVYKVGQYQTRLLGTIPDGDSFTPTIPSTTHLEVRFPDGAVFSFYEDIENHLLQYGLGLYWITVLFN